MAGTFHGSEPLISWLVTRRLPLALSLKHAVPSGSDGVGWPDSSSVTPDLATIS
jgi:hypothetical protein